MSGPFAAVISYVAGKIFAAVLPIRSWNIGGYEFSLNPGPFNVKEHTLICMLAGITGSTPPYGITVVLTLEKRYMLSLRTGFSFLFILSSQFLGLGLAGFCRRLFVYPASAIWPSILSITAMLNALHAENDTKPGISRLRLFLWATMFICFAIVHWAIAPILYYSNVWKSGHLPIMGNSAFDRFAKPYNITRVFDPHTSRFNLTAYEEYSPLYLPISFTLTYILGFAFPPALVVQTILRYWPAIRRTVWSNRRIAEEKEDIHAKLMRRYPEVPLWCFLAIFMSCLALAIGFAFIQLDVDIPLSAIALSIALVLVFIIPQCYIEALAAQNAVINVVAQIIPGTLWPEKPMINMVFKAYTLSTLRLASNFVMTFKLAHYMKLPPRYTFLTVVVAQLLSTVAQLTVKMWIDATVQDVCMPGQAAELICANNQVWYTASIIWGLIGPKRQFGKGAVYYGPVYAAIAGAVLPLVVWWWNRRYRGPTWLKSFNPVVALSGPLNIPPATGINYSSSFGVGVIFRMSH
ncbi:hypothetical protein FRB90_003622 [Tulasnella sp. 427]|nr:hypothetical protein FRB90_003622 [Tulasnella sp. 427]